MFKPKTLTGDEVKKLSPERKQIAKLFKAHIDRAVFELGTGYDVSFQGRFDSTPIQILIEVKSKDGIP